MRLTKKQNGYTILEVMIVLAVTGVMFVSTVALLGDQSKRYQFKASTYNAQQAVQGYINDVQTGYFNIDNISPPSGCTSTGTSIYGNTNCMFVGKKITITTDGKIESTPIYLLDTQNPTSNTPQEYTATKVTKDLPYYVSYSPDTTFYVMFNNYTESSNGGTQSFGVYDNGQLNPMAAGGKVICLQEDGGSRQAKLIIGANGAISVDLVYENC